MTVSITHCSPSAAERARVRARALVACLRALLLCLGLCVHVGAHAAGAELRNVALGATEEGHALKFDVAFDLNARLEEVVSRGVPLYFVAEFELRRARWYWFDEDVVTRSLTYRLSYNALTRQYRLSTGALHQNFQTLEEALQTMTHVRNWLVAERGVLGLGTSYDARLRFRLDLAQMPKPFQVSAIGNKDWNLATDWLRWTYVPGAGGTEPK